MFGMAESVTRMMLDIKLSSLYNLTLDDEQMDFLLSAHLIHPGCDPNNPLSYKIYEKIGLANANVFVRHGLMSYKSGEIILTANGLEALKLVNQVATRPLNPSFTYVWRRFVDKINPPRINNLLVAEKKHTVQQLLTTTSSTEVLTKSLRGGFGRSHVKHRSGVIEKPKVSDEDMIAWLLSEFTVEKPRDIEVKVLADDAVSTYRKHVKASNQMLAKLKLQEQVVKLKQEREIAEIEFEKMLQMAGLGKRER